MKYYTSEELKYSKKQEAREILGKCSGPFVRYSFGINVFKKFFDSCFNNDINIKTLDLGSASGEFANQLDKIGYNNLYGIDIDNYVASKNKSLFKEFKTADLGLDNIPWPDNYFNVVTAWCVLPHLENPFHCVREVYRILAPGGLFIFSAPHLTSKAAIDYFIHKKDFGSYRKTNNHLVIFTPAIIDKAVLKYFDMVETQYAVRKEKIFRGWQGKIRKFLYLLISYISKKIKERIDYNWAYDAIYIVKKK